MVINLVVATKNPGKIREIRALLEGLGYRILSLEDFPQFPPVEERGETFLENALEKARAAARYTGEMALADDSGLEVEALGGAPGVRSARFGGQGLTDADRNRLLLEKLRGVPMEERKARFRCVMALVTPGGEEYVVEGTCEGYIAMEPRGDHGFGYDPVFYLPRYGKTMAQLPPEEKNRISHRAKALAGMREVLERLAGR